jgi:hypothetical protein
MSKHADNLVTKPCQCGSGLEREAQYDGYGIFLCNTCAKCHDQQLSKYRSDIFDCYECDEQIEDDY